MHKHMRVHTGNRTKVPNFWVFIPVPGRTLGPKTGRTKCLSPSPSLRHACTPPPLIYTHANMVMILPMGMPWLRCRGKSWSQLKPYRDMKEAEREWSRGGGRLRERGRNVSGQSWNVNLMGKVLKGSEIKTETEGELMREVKRLI